MRKKILSFLLVFMLLAVTSMNVLAADNSIQPRYGVDSYPGAITLFGGNGSTDYYALHARNLTFTGKIDTVMPGNSVRVYIAVNSSMQGATLLGTIPADGNYHSLTKTINTGNYYFWFSPNSGNFGTSQTTLRFGIITM